MSYVGDTEKRPAFGVLKVLSFSFSLLFRHAIFFIGVSILANVATAAIGYAITGNASTYAFNFTSGNGITQAIVALIGAFIQIGLMIVLTQGAYDRIAGQKGSFGGYANKAVWRFFPALVVGIIVTILAGLPPALLAFLLSEFNVTAMVILVPVVFFLTFYIFAIFTCTFPSLVVEDTGFGALKRSVNLTQDYRFAVMVTGFVMFFGLSIIVGLLASVVTGLVFGMGLGGSGLMMNSLIILQIVQMIVTGAMTAFFAIMLVVVLVRLKEIKEGFGTDDIADVFS